jgi:acyl dehydratase
VVAHRSAGPWQEALPGKPALARDWAQAVTPFAPPGTVRAEVELHLRGHLETLHDALLGQPPDTAAAERIGAALVGRSIDDPAALGATVSVLADRLLAELGLDEVTFAGPLHTLLGALAAGYARALADAATA